MMIFPKFLKAFLYLVLLITGASLVVDIGNAFMAESRNQFIARNSNVFVSKFAVEASKISEFSDGNIGVDDVKKSLVEYFDAQYINYDYVVGSHNMYSGSNKMVLRYLPGPVFTEGTEYNYFGPVTVRIVFIGFNTPNAIVSMEIEQMQPFTLRGFLRAQYESGLSGYDVLWDENSQFGYFYVKSYRAFKINNLKKAF